MLYSSTPAGMMLWQWANQSYNVCVNYANRNITGSQCTVAQHGASGAIDCAVQTTSQFN